MFYVLHPQHQQDAVRDEYGDGPVSDPEPHGGCVTFTVSMLSMVALLRAAVSWGCEVRVSGTAQVSLTMMISIGMGIRILFMYFKLSSLTTIRSTALTKA